MRQIKYQIKITGMNEKGRQVEIQTYASSAQELLKNIKDVLSKDSKTWIEKLLGF